MLKTKNLIISQVDSDKLLTEAEFEAVTAELINNASQQELSEMQNRCMQFISAVKGLISQIKLPGFPIDFALAFGVDGTSSMELLFKFELREDLNDAQREEARRLKITSSKSLPMFSFDGFEDPRKHWEFTNSLRRRLTADLQLSDMEKPVGATIDIYINLTDFSAASREECVHIIYQLRSLAWSLTKAKEDVKVFTRRELEYGEIFAYNSAYEHFEHIERAVTLLFNCALYAKYGELEPLMAATNGLISRQPVRSELLSLYGSKLNSRILSCLDVKNAEKIKPSVDLIKQIFDESDLAQSTTLKLAALRFGLGYLPNAPYSTLVDLAQILIDTESVHDAVAKTGIYLDKFLGDSTSELILTADKPIARPENVSDWVNGLCQSLSIQSEAVIDYLQKYFAHYDFSLPIIIDQDAMLEISELLDF
jgi:hypothetical protein